MPLACHFTVQYTGSSQTCITNASCLSLHRPVHWLFPNMYYQCLLPVTSPSSTLALPKHVLPMPLACHFTVQYTGSSQTCITNASCLSLHRPVHWLFPNMYYQCLLPVTSPSSTLALPKHVLPMPLACHFTVQYTGSSQTCITNASCLSLHRPVHWLFPNMYYQCLLPVTSPSSTQALPKHVLPMPLACHFTVQYTGSSQTCITNASCLSLHRPVHWLFPNMYLLFLCRSHLIWTKYKILYICSHIAPCSCTK